MVMAPLVLRGAALSLSSRFNCRMVVSGSRVRSRIEQLPLSDPSPGAVFLETSSSRAPAAATRSRSSVAQRLIWKSRTNGCRSYFIRQTSQVRFRRLARVIKYKPLYWALAQMYSATNYCSARLYFSFLRSASCVLRAAFVKMLLEKCKNKRGKKTFLWRSVLSWWTWKSELQLFTRAVESRVATENFCREV